MHIVVNGWFAGQSTTGSGQYTDQIARHLAAAGHRVTVLIGDWGSGTGDWGLGIGDSEGIGGLAIRRLKIETPSLSFLSRHSRSPVPSHRSPVPSPQSPITKIWWEQITVPRAAKRLGADVLLVPYWAAPWWQPVPTVVTVHDVVQLILPEYRGGRLFRWYTRLVSATARRAAAVLTVSHASARDIVQKLGIPGERVFAVHHGVNGDASAVGDAAFLATIRAKYNLPERYFLYLGGFDVRKNVDGILRSYARYLEKGGDPAQRLVIAGKLPATDTDFAPDPRRMAAELGLGDHVHFTGWVDDAEKPALYALATAFLFPSRYEGFGMMLLEAMAAGAPVITSAK